MSPKRKNSLASTVSQQASPPEPPALPDDPRLLEAVQEYLTRLEAGGRPSRQEFLDRWPDLAGPLAQCLDGLEMVHQATAFRPKHAEAPAPTDVYPVNPLGDFRIVREIGRGGMGIVYEAVQLSLGRRVALKVLPFAATFDARHLQRFQNEAQAAAQLHHTNIVPVYYVGCERGVHFYAMQLIEGQSLAVLIRQLRKEAGLAIEEEPAAAIPLGPEEDTHSALTAVLTSQRSGREREFFRAAARLMVQAAEALEHAHQLGIVHRDIKPANLLVDARGNLWVTDFGLAQFHADAGLTRTGDLLGTLRYMSPEQASGQRVLLDHRTDIYSLGATLYELVTLRPIFDGQSREELLQQITNREPQAPRAINHALPVELETILLKAVSKNPVERYATAQELADDLQRFLDDKPIRARRPSLLDRARKWSRRHPAVVAAGVLLLLLCVAGLLVNNRMIAREQTKTEEALENARQRAEEAEKRYQQARHAVDLLLQVSEEELADFYPLQGVRKKLLETALGYYTDFIEQHQGDADSHAELEKRYEDVRRILDELYTLQGAHHLMLLADPEIQKDLGLTGTQIDRLKRWSGQRPPAFPEPRPFFSRVDRQKFLDAARANEKALGEILTPGQLERLRQIALQLQGPQAFRDPHVVDALQLTADQKQQIREIKEKTFAAFRPGPPPRGGPGGPPRHFEFEKVMRQEVEQILKLLTPEQEERWHELTGKPFQGTTSLLGPIPFGPRAPRAGQAGPQ